MIKMSTSLKVFALLLIFTKLITTQTSTLSFDYNQYINFHWKGALTSHSILIKTFPYLQNLRQNNSHTFLFLYTYTNPNEIQVQQILDVTFPDTENSVAITQIDSLNPLTSYYYTYLFSPNEKIETEDFLNLYASQQLPKFSFTTLGIAVTPFNFTFGAASCSDTGSTSPVFTNLVNENLNFFLHMGDIHYQNIAENNTDRFYDAYYRVFASETQKSFFQDTPIVYVWDDHDFGPDNSNGKSLSRDAVNKVYREFAPNGPLKSYLPADDSQLFPLEAPSTTQEAPDYVQTYPNDDPYGIFRSIIVGKCLFIIMDLRSFKDVKPNDILGDEQKVWLENQFKFVALNDQIKMVFLVSTLFWLDNNFEGEWSAYPATQQMIADFARNYVFNKGKQIIGLSGDTHAMAFDDGRNNYNGGFPILQAAPLDSFPICAGGPYSHGVSVDRGQYSVIQVQDNGDDKICVNFKLKKLGNTLIEYDTCHKELYPGSEGVSCPKLVVGGSEGFSYVTIIIIGIVIIIGVGGFIAWYCLRKYKDKEKKIDEKAQELLEMSHSN